MHFHSVNYNSVAIPVSLMIRWYRGVWNFTVQYQRTALLNKNNIWKYFWLVHRVQKRSFHEKMGVNKLLWQCPFNFDGKTLVLPRKMPSLSICKRTQYCDPASGAPKKGETNFVIVRRNSPCRVRGRCSRPAWGTPAAWWSWPRPASTTRSRTLWSWLDMIIPTGHNYLAFDSC